MDFGYSEEPINNNIVESSTEETTETKEVETDNQHEEVEDIDSNKKEEVEDKENNNTDEPNHNLEVGTVIELGDNKYTVDANGDIIDSNGKLFKEAKDVKEWLKEFDSEDNDEDPNEVNISNIQKNIGIDVVDENNNPIEFDNSIEGITNYVNAVIENSRNEVAEQTINTLYSKYPIVEQVLNYYIANGNSLEGFNEIPDRSNITIDPNNEEQCEAVIKAAWKEEKRKGNVDNYIQFLKSQGTLSATAEEELEAMKARDEEYKNYLAEEAEKTERENIEMQRKYWGGVKQTIDNRVIAGYKLPETIVRIVDGKRYSATPNDFFNYIYQVDKNGHSRYENDLAKENPTDRMNDELLRAYIKFSGGSYESLVKMAINEDKVKSIKLKSKSAPKAKVKITPKNNSKKDIDFGY